MGLYRTTRKALLPVALLPCVLLPLACFGQTAPPAAPCPAPSQSPAPAPDPSAKPCTPSNKPKSAAEQFPFPGEPTTQPAAPPPPDTPKPSTSPSDAAAQHPFPGQTTGQPPAKSSGDDSSSSSSSSSNPGDADAPPADDATAKGDPPEGTSVHRKLPKPKRVLSDDERVDEDLYVAKFYMRDENYQGAYLRAKDAISIQPDYSAPHFALAEIALKMKKKDEAIAEYQTYLKLDPEGEKANAAKKALAGLQ